MCGLLLLPEFVFLSKENNLFFVLFALSFNLFCSSDIWSKKSGSNLCINYKN